MGNPIYEKIELFSHMMMLMVMINKITDTEE